MKDKARPLITPSYREMRDVEAKPGQENDLAAAAERFATALRTASVETGPRESKSAWSKGSEALFWATTFESKWHRQIGHTNPSTLH